ncbi:MAG TPA: DUF3172 domain-containing protein [Thermosynechococcaceae cyanobacterium]
MKRKSKNVYDYERDPEYVEPDSGGPKRKSGKSSAFNVTSLAVLAGVFILGVGVGVGFYSASSSTIAGNKIDNSIQLESQIPDKEFCIQYGAAAITTDMRVFVTLNPFSVFVSQPTTRPGCVMRASNWTVLEQRGLLKSDQIRDCKDRLNTFGFTGSLANSPQIDCIYQNNAAQNLFLPPGTNTQSDNDRFK